MIGIYLKCPRWRGFSPLVRLVHMPLSMGCVRIGNQLTPHAASDIRLIKRSKIIALLHFPCMLQTYLEHLYDDDGRCHGRDHKSTCAFRFDRALQCGRAPNESVQGLFLLFEPHSAALI